MPSLVISINGAFVQEVVLTKEHTTIGRRPYNNIVLNDLTVSGEHALLHWAGGRISLEDLQSTNGSYVNRQRITHQQLQHGDLLDIGRYQLRLQLPPGEIASPNAANA